MSRKVSMELIVLDNQVLGSRIGGMKVLESVQGFVEDCIVFLAIPLFIIWCFTVGYLVSRLFF